MLLRWRRVASEKGRLRSVTVRFVACDVGDGAPVPAPAAAVAKATPKSPTARRPSTGKASPKAHTGYKSIKAALAAAKLDPSWAAAFDDAAIGVGELQLYASPQELREELERGGTYRVPLAVVSKVLSLVLETNVPSPHAREQALLRVGGGAAPATTLAAGMACGQAMASAANGEATRRETERWADIFADEDDERARAVGARAPLHATVADADDDADLPLVESLTVGLPGNERAAVVAQCLALADITPITAFDAATNADMNEERLERAMQQRGIGAAMLRPRGAASANTARKARLHFANLWERAASAPSRQAAARPREAAEAGGGVLSLDGLHAAQFVQLGGSRKDAASLEEEASMERIGAVARNAQAFESLRELQAAAKAGDDAKMARGYVAASKMLPEVANLLHQQQLVIPNGTHGLNSPGVSGVVSLDTARLVAKWALHVQREVPGAVARVCVVPTVAMRMRSASAADLVEQLVVAAWFGNLASTLPGAAASTGKMDFAKWLEAEPAPSLLGKSVKHDADKAMEFHVRVWPILETAIQEAHPSDASAAGVLKQVGALIAGDGSGAALMEGQQQLLAPLLAQLSQAWKRHAIGRDYPACEQVWLQVKEQPHVAAWLQEQASARPKTAPAMAALQSQNDAMAKRLAKLEAAAARPATLRPKPGKPGPPVGEPPPQQPPLSADKPEGWADFTKAQKDKWRYEKWQAKIAAKKAAEEAAAPTETES